MTIISSLQNSLVKKVVKLHAKKYRDQTELFIVEGHHLVEAAKQAKLLVQLFATKEYPQATIVTPDVMKKMSTTKTLPPVLAICKRPTFSTQLGKRVLVLDHLQDPGNVGTLIRTARAFNWDAVLVAGVDIYQPKVVRSTQGALFTMPVIQVKTIVDYFPNYFVIGAVVTNTSASYKTIKPQPATMLILGNEGAGLSQEVLKQINASVYIPINYESLNVAQAGAILLNHYQPNS